MYMLNKHDTRDKLKEWSVKRLKTRSSMFH